MKPQREPRRVRVVGYARVSTKEQANSGVSIEAQQEKIRAYCQVFDLDLVCIREDRGRSAKTLDREGLQLALGDLREGRADALLVVKLDRLVRSTVGLGYLVEQYFSEGQLWSLLSVAENIDTRTAAGRLVANVLASVGQWEREAIVERTRDALAHLRALGVVLGADSFGRRRRPKGQEDQEGRRLIEEVTQELEAVLLIRTWWDTGMSLREICRRLDEAGVAPKRAGRPRRVQGQEEPVLTRGVWHPKVVRSILLRDGVSPEAMQQRRHQEAPRAA